VPDWTSARDRASQKVYEKLIGDRVYIIPVISTMRFAAQAVTTSFADRRTGHSRVPTTST